MTAGIVSIGIGMTSCVLGSIVIGQIAMTLVSRMRNVPDMSGWNMTPLPDVAHSCGYTVISNRAQTVMEIEGLGNWPVLELACHQFVFHHHNGHSYDHVSVIYRDPGGVRTLLDVGVNDVRYGTLPSAGFKWKPRRPGMYGVRQMCHRFVCQITAHGQKVYLGMFATAEGAALARDRYVIEHELSVPLNYPKAVMV